MTDNSTTKTTVRVDEQFAEELDSLYPAANSLPQALLHAAQDGVDFRQAISGDPEAFVREVATDEVADEPPRPRADD